MIRAFPTLILRGVLASGRVSILILVKPKGLEWHLTIKSGKVQRISMAVQLAIYLKYFKLT
jgi:hypothetical protein